MYAKAAVFYQQFIVPSRLGDILAVGGDDGYSIGQGYFGINQAITVKISLRHFTRIHDAVGIQILPERHIIEARGDDRSILKSEIEGMTTGKNCRGYGVSRSAGIIDDNVGGVTAAVIKDDTRYINPFLD